MATQTNESPKQFLGVEAFDETALETVQSLSPPPGTNFVMMQFQGNNGLWHPGADTPTTSNGFLSIANELVCIHQTNPEDVRVIRANPGASLFVAYYR